MKSAENRYKRAEKVFSISLGRQAEGIAIAKEEGRMTGRPKKAETTFEDVYLDCKAGKISAAKGAKKLGIARSTWYRKARSYEQEHIEGF